MRRQSAALAAARSASESARRAAMPALRCAAFSAAMSIGFSLPMADGEKLYKTIRQKYTNIINAAVEKCKGFGENAVAGFGPIWYSNK